MTNYADRNMRFNPSLAQRFGRPPKPIELKKEEGNASIFNL